MMNQQFNGVKQYGVVNGANDVSLDHLDIHGDERDCCNDLKAKNLPLASQILQMECSWTGSAFHENI